MPRFRPTTDRFRDRFRQATAGGGAPPNGLPADDDFASLLYAWRRTAADSFIYKENHSPQPASGLTDGTYCMILSSACRNGQFCRQTTSGSSALYEAATNAVEFGLTTRYIDWADGDTVRTVWEFVSNTQVYTIGFAGKFEIDPTVSGVDQYLCGNSNGTGKGWHIKYVNSSQTLRFVVQESSATVRLDLSVDASTIGTNVFSLVATADGANAALYLDGASADTDVVGTAFTGAAATDLHFGTAAIGTSHYKGAMYGVWIDPRSSDAAKAADIDEWLITLG